MLKLIEKIRQKPKSVKDHYAFYGAVGITGVIAVVWAVSLPAGLNQNPVPEEGGPRPAFSTLFGEMKDQFGALQANLANLSTTTDSAAEETDEVLRASTSLESAINTAITSTSSRQRLKAKPQTGRAVQIGTTSATRATTSNE